MVAVAGGDYHPPLELLAGIFARKGERELYDDTHPLNLLWNAFGVHARRDNLTRNRPDKSDRL
jgi:hypothetical protein